jgi:hypothetical protein
MKRMLIHSAPTAKHVQHLESIAKILRLSTEVFPRWKDGLETAVRTMPPAEIALIVTEVQDGGTGPQSRLEGVRRLNKNSPILLIIPNGWQPFNRPGGGKVGIIEKGLVKDYSQLSDLVTTLLEP